MAITKQARNARLAVLNRNMFSRPPPEASICVASASCEKTPVPDAPVALCAVHALEMYKFSADLITSRWDEVIREYVSDLHSTFKPPNALRAPRQGYVYFIQFDNRVKIGYSENPKQRLQGLPCDRVIGIIEGTRADEATWHKLLDEYRTNGEWFLAVPEVLETLERVAGSNP